MAGHSGGMPKLLLLGAGLGVMLAVSGCALGSAALDSSDDVTVVRSLQDTNAQRTIRARMTRAHGFLLSGVDVEVAQGVVVLSGRVPRPEDRIEAERIAWSAPRVDQVGNELRIGDKQSLARNAKDGLLEKSVRTRLIADGDVRARNLNVETHDGVVYLLGVARTEAELAEVARIASTTRGAREVVSYVRLVDGTPQPERRGYAEVPTATEGAIEDFFPQSPAYRVPDEVVGNGTATAPLAKLPDTEPYYRDPETGERIELAPGTVVIPYQPDTPGSLGAGGTPPPGGTGAPFYIDPDSGERIPVRYVTEVPR